jgi:hypothetical protein
MKNILIISFLLLVVTTGTSFAQKSVWDKSKVTLPENQSNPEIIVYHSPTCKCCKNWIKHLEINEFNVQSITTEDMKIVKQRHNLPMEAASCHTAIIDGYVIEGHVPADDIKRLVMTKPDIAGLSVPQMPVGPPGMEMSGVKDPFNVIAFDKNGNIYLYNYYKGY